VIHHTAAWTEDLSRIEQSEQRRYWFMPYHYIINKDGTYKEYNTLDSNVWSTRNERFNQRSIQVAFNWNYNIDVMTDAQKKTYKKIEKAIEERYWDQRVYLHRDVGKTACPWKNITLDLFIPSQAFRITNYYTPTVVNEYNKHNWAGDYSVTANGTHLTEAMAGKVCACPKEYPFWTKFKLVYNGKERVLTCIDRGSAIKGKRLDVWQGYESQWNVNWIRQNYYEVEVIKKL